MSDWNAQQYSMFERERTAPARDLANAIELSAVATALDVGCGTGSSTKVLAERFPGAQVIGVDNSDGMLSAARKKHPGLTFAKADVPSGLGTLGRTFDVVFSNACLQWIPSHAQLLPALMGLVAKGGVLAVQVPEQAKHPMPGILRKLAQSPAWSAKITATRQLHVLTPEAYFDLLADLSPKVRLWQTTYIHAMPSHQAIVDWYKGTGLRPYLDQLSDGDKPAFEADVLDAVRHAYPAQKNGTILFRFPRLFFTAQKP